MRSARPLFAFGVLLLIGACAFPDVDQVIAEDPSFASLAQSLASHDHYQPTKMEMDSFKESDVLIITNSDAAQAGLTPDLSTAERVKSAEDAGVGAALAIYRKSLRDFEAVTTGSDDHTDDHFDFVLPDTTKTDEEQIQHMVQQLGLWADMNGDGVIDETEFYRATTKLEAQMQDSLNTADQVVARMFFAHAAKLMQASQDDKSHPGTAVLISAIQDSVTQAVNSPALVEYKNQDPDKQLEGLLISIQEMNKASRKNWHNTPHPIFETSSKAMQTRSDLVQFAKKHKLFSHMDMILWGMKNGVDPAQMRRVMQKAGIKGDKEEEKFNMELELWGYESKTAFEPNPLFHDKPKFQQDLIQMRKEMYEGRQAGKSAERQMDELMTALESYKGKDITLSPADKQEVEEVMTQLEEESHRIVQMIEPAEEELLTEEAQSGPTCADISQETQPWSDQYNNGCDFYMEGNRCRTLGTTADKQGVTAIEACCICGGGARVASTSSRRLSSQWGSMSSYMSSYALQYSESIRCKNEQDTFSAYGCTPKATACTEDERPGTVTAIQDCSSELGRTLDGITAVGSVTDLFIRVYKMLEDCDERTKQGKCKGLKTSLTTITAVYATVIPFLTAIPVVGKIASIMGKALKIFDKVILILTKVFKGLAKVGEIVQKAKDTVTKAKETVDNELKPRSDTFYTAFGYVYGCKQQVCQSMDNIDNFLSPAQKFHEVAKTVTRQCADTLKPLNDGPLKLWREIKPLIDSLMKILDPVFDKIEEIFDAVNDFLAEVAEAFQAVKCCLPTPVQYLLNTLTSLVATAFCPVNELIDAFANTLGTMLKQAVMTLASKLVPNLKFTFGAWSSSTSLTANWNNIPHMCTHHNLANYNLNYNVGWASWSIDTSIVDNAGMEATSMSSVGQEIMSGVGQACAAAVSSFGDVFKTCECGLKIMGKSVDVDEALCFPAEATVVTPQGKKQISELKVGDCVLSKRADGSVDTCDEVYMFGHAQHGTSHLYHKLSLSSGSTIHLANKHFIHTSKSSATHFKQAVLKYAEDVSVGDWIWGANGEASQVYAIERVVLKGAFNPYTISGNIIVDDVVASAHSQWFLDEAVPRSMTRYLPAIYQSILSVNRVLHAAFGPVAAETLGLANNGLDAGDFWISYWPVVAASLVALVAAASSNTRKTL